MIKCLFTNKAYRHKIKYVGAMILILTIGIISAGCRASEWEYDPITDVNDLEGRRIGVNLSWESDYYLTGRKDMQLFRYDATSDMIMALKYDKIDALALDQDSAKLVLSQSDGIELVEPSLATLGSVMYFATDKKDLMDDFNKYLAEFKKTDEYKDLVKRIDEYDGTEYIGTDIPLTGTGEVLRIATDPNNFPRAFLNPGEEIITGYDVEILKHYANDRNYQLEFAYSTYNDGTIGLQNGMYDIMTGYICDVYKSESENIGINVCDSMYGFSLYFLQKNQRDITSNTSVLD